ncbi:MAG: flippase [Acidobacteriota bacterium]|nr:flippase [Acidobacteriota bacterium]
MRSSLSRLVSGLTRPTSVRHRLIGGMGGLLGLRVAFSGLSFAGTFLLTRLLGSSGFGAYSYSLAWIFLLAVPSLLGLDQLLVREVAANHARAEWGTFRGLLRRANQAVLLVSCASAMLAAFVSWLLPQSAHGGIRPTFLLALFFLPLITLMRVRQAAMQGLHQVTLGALPEQLVQPGLLLAFLAVVYTTRHRLGAPAAMLANLTAAAVAYGLGLYLLRRSLPAEMKAAAAIYRDGEWIRSSLPLMFVAGVAVLFAQADTLILGAFRSTAEVGLYTLAHKGSELIGIILTVQVAAFASTAANLYALGEIDRLQRIVTRLARWTLLGSAPVALFMLFFGRWYLRLYGPEYVQAAITLAILSAGQLASVSLGCVGILLIMTGHERRVAIAMTAGAVSNVGLSFALAPHWGAEGVAVAYSASIILWNVWAAVELYRRTGLHATALGKWL